MNSWHGRHPDKDALRAQVWSALVEQNLTHEPPWQRIPNFIGAEQATARLAQQPWWRAARTIKVNPDRPQAWIRLLALQQGKRVYMPIPELRADPPFVLLDPQDLGQRSIDINETATSQQAAALGQPVAINAMAPLDICVIGSVAVTGDGARLGKGGGFADLELALLQAAGCLPANCPIITTVCDTQVLAAGDIPMQPHDARLDWIITPTHTMATQAPPRQTLKLDWQALRPDQLKSIPTLQRAQRIQRIQSQLPPEK